VLVQNMHIEDTLSVRDAPQATCVAGASACFLSLPSHLIMTTRAVYR
jgi:hypothetical protein